VARAYSLERQNAGRAQAGRDADASSKSYFGKSPLDYVFEEESVFILAQRSKEKARDYTHCTNAEIGQKNSYSG